MNKHKLSQSTIEKLGYYVYLLIDDENDEIFYVGKGKGNRINQHIFGALNHKTNETEKIKRIRKIQNEGREVKFKILRHSLEEKAALEVESSVIDLLGKENLTNIVKGRNSEDKGIMDLKDIIIKYEAKKANIEEPTILININSLYKRNMSYEEIYKATRSAWKVDINNASKVKFACTIYRGIIREVFKINKWVPTPDKRYAFEGEIAPKEIREKYLNKSVAEYWEKKGSQQPLRYILPIKS